MNHPENLIANAPKDIEVQTQEILKQVIEAWHLLKTTRPLVHCMTNQVAANYVANVLLAAGASPAMIDNPFEAESFVGISQALSINLGTPHTEQVAAMKIATETAHKKNIPWVLDPVGYSAVLPWRTEITNDLLRFKPTIIRGNASEIGSLAGQQNQSKGVDSTLDSAAVVEQAKTLLDFSECIAISGESDFILSKSYRCMVKINGGSYLQPKVTATGCALGALIAAYAGVTNPTIACIAAHVHFAIAGKLAYTQAQTVGSFNVAFIDELYSYSAEKIQNSADIEILTFAA
ncbi:MULTISPECIES: hydroxyethylthiazole kinase [unclassified Acinetobacter]|uniref:hydroxyethylthiazole kinase n=1 Tax=unclassified Acinetobacter TaxID=196816 RepID=UPI00044E78B0|nr:MULTISPECIES: hydroxyethylthiazole kinase [unclassified Acinetobacter]EZQ12488.1 hydroxyethylthiazole kinase [Acinetobacter sp. Ver3]SEL45455.1 hydroxyethylthiazole kinase [Acinetobacter sp. DSM 11652]